MFNFTSISPNSKLEYFRMEMSLYNRVNVNILYSSSFRDIKFSNSFIQNYLIL